MRFGNVAILASLGLLAASLHAQVAELGFFGGFGYPRQLTASTPSGSGKAGFKYGAAAGVVVGDDMHRRLSGEVRYVYRVSDLKVAGGGQEASFNGETHTVHYDFVYHMTDRGEKVRPFVAGGAGIKFFRGTGLEHSYQPASKYALLTRTTELVGLVSAGAGVKVALSDLLQLRVEARDYITPFPKQVVTPAPGAEIKGWLHDFVPMVGISFRF